MAQEGVTYHEVRTWARWLDTFTPNDLCDALGVPYELGDRFVLALTWHGIVEDTGESYLNGHGYPENVYAYVPLPPGPKEHPHEEPPESVARREMGGDPLGVPRGMPVRLVDNSDRRNQMQMGGGGRMRHKLRDERYKRMQEAIQKRIEEQKAKAHKDPKWKRRK